MARRFLFALSFLVHGVAFTQAAPPIPAFIYPAGGQKGTTVPVRVGASFIHKSCQFRLDGHGVTPLQTLKRVDPIWFEGPILPLPESQQSEDYPANLLGQVTIAPDAPTGPVRGYISTSQGAGSGLMFVVGDLPEVVEQERDGDPIPTKVTLPVTANGRIFPRENIDLWEFTAKAGQSITLLATTTAFRSPLVAKLEILDSNGNRLVENDNRPIPGADTSLRFVAPHDGIYHARISDPRNLGGPQYVYRLTMTTGPIVDHAFPLGGRRGESIAVKLAGQGLTQKPVKVQIPKDAITPFRTTLSVNNQLTNTVTFDLSDAPEFGPTIPKEPIAAPAVLNGIVDTAPQNWPIQMRKGIDYGFTLKARELGSPLCGVITVTNSQSAELTTSELPNSAATDPTLKFRAPTDGTYTVRITERFRNRSGPTSAYRLHVESTDKQVNRLTLSTPTDVVNVPRGGTLTVRVTAVRHGGFSEPITLSLDDLPPGVSAKIDPMPKGKSDRTIKLTAEATAKVTAIPLRLHAKVTVMDGKQPPQVIEQTANLFLAVTVPTPFKVVGEYTMTTAPRGQVYRRKYTIERNGYEGPLEIRLAERQTRHLQGVTANAITVPAGQNEFTFTANLPPWLELGRTCRVCVMAVGIVKDPDGAEHPVMYSSVDQNQQMIVVAEPGRLDVELLKPIVAVTSGSTVKVPFRVSRAKGLVGPARVEVVMPSHWRGVTAEPVTVDGELGEIVVKVGQNVTPFNMPLTVRATVRERGDPVVAEAKLELVQ